MKSSCVVCKNTINKGDGYYVFEKRIKGSPHKELKIICEKCVMRGMEIGLRIFNQ